MRTITLKLDRTSADSGQTCKEFGAQRPLSPQRVAVFAKQGSIANQDIQLRSLAGSSGCLDHLGYTDSELSAIRLENLTASDHFESLLDINAGVSDANRAASSTNPARH